MKKVLVLGGTGAMGVYLIPELLKLGYAVTCISLDDRVSENPRLTYIKGNAKDMTWLEPMLKQGWDSIVDFMIYGTESFRAIYRKFLDNTAQYIYLSSYRVYANEEHPIRETSPRLLDLDMNPFFKNSEDYSLHKARGEETLKASGYHNWTAIRPAITYSQRRFQLVTLEANVLIARAVAGKTVVIPEEAMNVEATMSWGGDVGKMIAGLVCNPAALGEVFTVATAEHHKWGEIAEYYRDIAGLKYITVSTEDYLKIHGGEQPNYVSEWQLRYDRYFDRIVDNTKILTYTGMKQSELMPLYDGLKREFDALPKNYNWGKNAVSDRMEEYLAKGKRWGETF